MSTLPVFYSFRRCPYAMRARMALAYSGQQVELREILLKDKPNQMLEVSAKATVPVLILSDGTVIDESLDVATWALTQNDHENWIPDDAHEEAKMFELIVSFDDGFKHHLDHTKYATRHAPQGTDVQAYSDAHRKYALAYLEQLETMLEGGDFLFGSQLTLGDIAIAPFIRQFANTDITWFEAQALPNVQRWLARFLASSLFNSVMEKYPVWQSNAKGIIFPPSP